MRRLTSAFGLPTPRPSPALARGLGALSLGLALAACAPTVNQTTYDMRPVGTPQGGALASSAQVPSTQAPATLAPAPVTPVPPVAPPVAVTPPTPPVFSPPATTSPITTPQVPNNQVPSNQVPITQVPSTQGVGSTVTQTPQTQVPQAPTPVLVTPPAPPAGYRTLAPLSPERLTTFSAAQQVIDPAKSYRAILKTSRGDVVVDLNAKAAPKTVNNFVFLALNRFYDGTRFHRVIDGFMAQGGDPQSADPRLQALWGTGGPGYRFGDETDSGLSFDRPGLLAMANAGPGTNGSQFFITYAPTPFLNGRHTIFGTVVSGQAALNALTRNYDNSGMIPGAGADLLQTVEIQVMD